MSAIERNRRFACIWLPNWPLQRALTQQPELGEAAILLAARDARRGMLVQAASRSARQVGVRVGMKMSEARALSPDSIIMPHEPEEDLDALCHLAEAAQMFSPIVGIEQLDKTPWAGRSLHYPEALLLEVTGIPPLFGGEEQLAEAMAQRLWTDGLMGCIAIGDTIGAAWAVANFGLRNLTTAQHYLAEAAKDEEASASKAANISRFRIIGGATELAMLPAESLRLDAKTVQSLGKLGCRTIAEVLGLPRSGIAGRLGHALLKRLDQLTDASAEAIVTHSAGQELSFLHNLEYPTEDIDILGESLRQLCAQLARRLSQGGDGALRIVCRLDQLEAPPVVMQVGFFRPTQDAEHLTRLLRGQLEQQLRTDRFASVQRTHLQATLTAPLVWRQADLFDESPLSNDSQIASLIDTLSARMGRGRVLSANVRRDAQPELGFALRPMTGLLRTGTAQDTSRKLSSRLATRRAEPTPTDPLRRPTHLFSPAKEIELRTKELANPAKENAFAEQAAESGVPGASEKQMRLQFLFERNWHTVVNRQGPERLESGWWKGPSSRRDYYRFVTADGSWWWVFRDMNTNTWFLHGRFD